MIKDLKFTYTNTEGEKTSLEYDTIVDFLDAIENHEFDAPPLDGKDVEAMLFQNPLYEKRFNTVDDLYLFCRDITR